MQVELYKKRAVYEGKDGKQKQTFNFFLKCGSSFIPIDVKRFNDHDNKYLGRRDVVSAFAQEFEAAEE